MRELNYEEIMSSANELVDKVHETYDNGNMEDASKNYHAIYDLICPNNAPDMEERFSILNEVISNLSDQEIADITDYNKAKFTERTELSQSLSNEIVYEDNSIKISETSRDVEFAAIIENKTNEDIVVLLDGEEFATIEVDDWVGLTNDKYEQLNDFLSYAEPEVKSVDEHRDDRGYDRDDYDDYDR